MPLGKTALEGRLLQFGAVSESPRDCLSGEIL
jgi:hypothetical protein